MQDCNAVPTAIPTFSGFNYPMGVVAMLYDQTGRNWKWELQDDGNNFEKNTFISACTRVNNDLLTAVFMLT